MADSVIIIVICFGILTFGLTYSVLTYAQDAPINLINNQIDSGMLSADTIENFNLMLDLWKTLPIIFALGLIMFCYERAKGTSIGASVFFEYETLLILSVVFSTYFVYIYGMSADQIFSILDRTEIIANIDPRWETSELKMLMLKMMYNACLIPGFLGCLLYLIHPILRQTDNTYSFYNDDDEGGNGGSGGTGEYITRYEPLQFQ